MRSALAAHRLSVLLIASLLTAAGALPARAADSMPDYQLVQSVVTRHFKAIPEFREGDIITKSDAEPVFDYLRRLSWNVSRRKQILDKVPGDSDFVVRQLRSKGGRKFMRQVSGYPLAYDRLYRLAAMPRGRVIVNDLIHTKDGSKLIAYMSNTQRGKKLGNMLGKAPRGEEFNKPIGKIFTVEALLKELKKAYQHDIQQQGQLAQQGS